MYVAADGNARIFLNAADGHIYHKGNLYTNGSATIGGGLTLTGNQTVTGNLTVGGTVTAQEFHAEFVSSSIIYESGSTKFGNSYDDYHDFTGSIRVDSTADSHFVGGGFVGIGTASPIEDLHIETSATAGGITVSGSNPHVAIDDDGASDPVLLLKHGGTASWSIRSDFSRTNLFDIRNASGDSKFVIEQAGDVGIGTTNPAYELDIYNATNATARIRGLQTGTSGYADLILESNAGLSQIFKVGTGYTSNGGPSSLNI